MIYITKIFKPFENTKSVNRSVFDDLRAKAFLPRHFKHKIFLKIIFELT